MPPVWLTEAELRERYGDARVDERADRDRDRIPDEGVVEAAILDGEGRIESKLLTRYSVAQLPATTGATGQKLKRLAAQMAWVYLNRGYYETVPAWVDALEEATLREAGEVATGGEALGLDDEPAVDVARGAAVVSRRSTSLSEQPITLASMERWGR